MNRDEELNMARPNMERKFMEPQKKNYWWDVLKIGIGFIAGSMFTFVAMMFVGYFMSLHDIRQEIEEDPILSPRMGTTYDEASDMRYFQVRSKDRHATIHTGMSKDSVILLLGQPTEFHSSNYLDEITYRYGKYDLNSLRIEFEKGKVSSVVQN